MERDIDFVKTSMNIEDLNKMIIFLRHTSRLCRAQVIQKLIRKITVYKNKRGTKSQVEQNLNKCQKLIEEIQLLKAAHVDNITKYALNCPLNFEILSNQKFSLKDRAFTRVACHKSFKTFVEDWRSKHSDWKSLAAFVQTHISRRYKKNKNVPFKKQKLTPQIDRSSAAINIIKFSDKEESDSEFLNDVQTNNFNNGNVPKSSNEKMDSDSSAMNENPNYSDSESKNSTDLKDEHTTFVKNQTNNETLKRHFIKPGKNKNTKFSNELSENPTQKVSAYKNLLLSTNQPSAGQTKTSQPIINYRDGNVLVKQFDLNNLHREGELEFGLAVDETSTTGGDITVTKDNFFLRDGEDENDAVDAADEMLISWEADTGAVVERDETEFRGKYPNKFPQKRFGGNDPNGFENNKKGFGMPRKNNGWSGGAEFKGYARKSFKNGNQDLKKKNYRKDNGKTVNFKIKKIGSSSKGSLHPSWEASKKKKEQQSITKFQGKKIVFDD